MGVYCARASCSTKCHQLYLLRVRAYLLILIETWSDLRPTWKVLLKPKGASLQLHRRFRSEVTKRLGRRKIEYAFVSHLKPGAVHEHGFVRGGTREQIIACIKGAAEKVGYPLTPSNWSVTTFDNLEGFVTYVSKREQVYRPAPKRWWVLVSSRRFVPLRFKDGQIITFKRKLRDEKKIDRKMLKGLRKRIEKRYDLFAQRYGVRPNEIAQGRTP